jgi:hypothetical protein
MGGGERRMGDEEPEQRFHSSPGEERVVCRKLWIGFWKIPGKILIGSTMTKEIGFHDGSFS